MNIMAPSSSTKIYYLIRFHYTYNVYMGTMTTCIKDYACINESRGLLSTKQRIFIIENEDSI